MLYLFAAIFLFSALCMTCFFFEYITGRLATQPKRGCFTVYQWALLFGWFLTPMFMISVTIYKLTGGSL